MALIDFVCTKREHDNGVSKDVDHLTIHDGSWAFCPLDVSAKDHEWRSTDGGKSIVEILAQHRPRPSEHTATKERAP